LQRLSAEGLIRIDPHRGAVVAKPTLGDVNQIYELQIMLESTAARAAASGCSPDGLAAVEEALHEHDQSISGPEWVETNVAFHTSIYRLADRPLMLEMIGGLRNRAALYVNLLARSDKGRARADREHHEMYAALREADGDRLEMLVRQHLGATLEWLQTIIED
jgi:DNA-binding GntR family transcriptional regulator